MAREGLLAELLAAGATVSEPTCGACAGIGHVPATGTRSLRAFNRNFPGRSGTPGDEVLLCSPVTAAASAVTGVVTDPRGAGARAPRRWPGSLVASDAGLVPPAPETEAARAEVVKGPSIRPVPLGRPVEEALAATVLIKLGDKVSTDDISPSGAQALLFRTNVPALAEFCFRNVDPGFVARARAAAPGVIVGGQHYGQGSSREAAVLSPLHLGVRAVIAKGFARIHRANLINWGLLPLQFEDPADHDRLEPGDRLLLPGLRQALAEGSAFRVTNERTGDTFRVACELTARERRILLAGGILAHVAATAGREDPEGSVAQADQAG
jgi:aconitate hydratase